ncbi:MAG: hypothetical protein ABSD38_30250 [Syntrophorhabdales bacterium]|jgi:hypothetical protein
MKFLVIARIEDSFYALSPKKQAELWEAMTTVTDKLTKEGEYKAIYMQGNMKSLVLICDMKSSEDMARFAFENPMFAFLDAELTPLIDIDVVRKARRKK